MILLGYVCSAVLHYVVAPRSESVSKLITPSWLSRGNGTLPAVFVLGV